MILSFTRRLFRGCVLFFQKINQSNDLRPLIKELREWGVFAFAIFQWLSK